MVLKRFMTVKPGAPIELSLSAPLIGTCNGRDLH